MELFEQNNYWQTGFPYNLIREMKTAEKQHSEIRTFSEKLKDILNLFIKREEKSKYTRG